MKPNHQSRWNDKNMPQVLNGCMCQEGTCESCNQLVEAFEAIREALRTMSEYWRNGKPIHAGAMAANEAIDALALADKVTNERD